MTNGSGRMGRALPALTRLTRALASMLLRAKPQLTSTSCARAPADAEAHDRQECVRGSARDESVPAGRRAALRLARREAHVAIADNCLTALAARAAVRLEPASAALRGFEGSAPLRLRRRSRSRAAHRVDEGRRRGRRVVVVRLRTAAKARPLLVPSLDPFLGMLPLRLRHLSVW